MRDDLILLAHGNGGKKSRQLIEEIFLSRFGDKTLSELNDASPIECKLDMMITTDGYTVEPLFFPGGDIGKLAVCGSVNDLVVSGAIPRYMSCNFFIEEGFSIALLERIVDSMAHTAEKNSIKIVTGDTKILPKGSIDGIYIATTAIGEAQNKSLFAGRIQPDDKLFMTGSLGDHGAAIMLAREAYGLSSQLSSDCESVLEIGKLLMDLADIKFMRDPTRGGLASVCHELIDATNLGIQLSENNIPIKEEVSTFCNILGFSPYYLANEGCIVFVADKNWQPDSHLASNHSIYEIGHFTAEHQNMLLKTEIGGLRIIPELDADPLPRIC